MFSKLIQFLIKVRVYLLPTAQEKEVKRWFTDNPDENLRYIYDLSETSLVIDLDGYKGQWASDIYARYNCNILVFEPVKQFSDNIEKRFSHNPKISVYPFALGSEKRSEMISINNDATSVFSKSGEKQKINFESLKDFFERHNIEHIDLLKMNIEGGEYEILPLLIELGIVNNIKNLQIQFHKISSDSENEMHKIQEQLSKTHTTTFDYKFVWQNWTLK